MISLALLIGVNKPCHSKGEKTKEEMVLALWEVGYLEEQGRNRVPKETKKKNQEKDIFVTSK